MREARRIDRQPHKHAWQHGGGPHAPRTAAYAAPGYPPPPPPLPPLPPWPLPPPLPLPPPRPPPPPPKRLWRKPSIAPSPRLAACSLDRSSSQAQQVQSHRNTPRRLFMLAGWWAGWVGSRRVGAGCGVEWTIETRYLDQCLAAPAACLDSIHFIQFTRPSLHTQGCLFFHSSSLISGQPVPSLSHTYPPPRRPFSFLARSPAPSNCF